MTPEEIAQSLQNLTPQQLRSMDHSSLYAARGRLPRDARAMHDKIAPYEHRAFAREATAENPLMALPIAAGTLAYQPYKLLMGQSRSGASLDQVGHGLAGVGEGLWQAFQQMLQGNQESNLENALRSYRKGPK